VSLFVHEHLRRRPAGSRVRTIARGKHRLRIAFPRGPRRRGAGKLLEILHPRTENPQLCRLNPGELLILGNPARRHNSAKGEQLYEEFHGEEAQETMRVSEPQDMPAEAVVLGELVELKIESPKGLVQVKFPNDGIKVASNTRGSQLYFVGGNQNLDSMLDTFGANGSNLVRLGKAEEITYLARKSMDGFEPSNYVHTFGEESGRKPVAMYDRRIQRIYLQGGNYRVEAPGIID
jgi:hypothetical protein